MPFTIRIDHEVGELPRRAVYEVARYEVAYEQPRNVAARLTMHGVTGMPDAAGKDVLLSSGEAAYVMNAAGETIDTVRTVRARTAAA